MPRFTAPAPYYQGGGVEKMDTWKLRREKILTRPQVRSILELSKKTDDRDYLILVIAANTGFRISEILHLEESDVGVSTLRVTRRKKSRLVAEDAPISRGLAKIIRYYEESSPHKKARKPKSKFLFPGLAKPCVRGKKKFCAGGHVSKREVQRRWTAYLDALKLRARGRGIHTLRHYAGTEFYSTHKDLRATQVFMGHSSSGVTETYAHVVEMADKVGRVKLTL